MTVEKYKIIAVLSHINFFSVAHFQCSFLELQYIKCCSKWSRKIAFSSLFFIFFPRGKEKFFSGVLKGKQPFQQSSVIDVLDDYKVQTSPTPKILCDIVLKISTMEFVDKHFLPLLKIREGMGSFWNSVSKKMIDAVYALCNPCTSIVAKHLHGAPASEQEAKVIRWLNSYLSEARPGTLTRFFQFCTGSQVVIPDQNINVRMEAMSSIAMRLKARVCFRVLEIPINYLSFNQMKDTLDFFFNCLALWQMED